ARPEPTDARPVPGRVRHAEKIGHRGAEVAPEGVGRRQHVTQELDGMAPSDPEQRLAEELPAEHEGVSEEVVDRLPGVVGEARSLRVPDRSTAHERAGPAMPADPLDDIELLVVVEVALDELARLV